MLRKKKIKLYVTFLMVLALICSSVSSVYAVTIKEDNLAKYNIVQKRIAKHGKICRINAGK